MELHEHQPRHVGDGDDEEERDGAEKKHQRRPVIADPDFLQVANLDARVLVRLRILLAERLLDTREILTRLLERDAA